MNIVKKKRLELGLTQPELAQKSGVSLRTISRIESGASNITQRTGEALAIALHCSYADLVDNGKDNSLVPHSDAEQFLLDTFRSVDDATKDEIMRYIRYQKYCARESKKHVG